MENLIKCTLCDAQNEVKYLLKHNDNCINCGKNAGIMRLKPPKSKAERKRTYKIMPFGKFKGRYIYDLVHNERWYIDYLLSVDISDDLRTSIKEYL